MYPGDHSDCAAYASGSAPSEPRVRLEMTANDQELARLAGMAGVIQPVANGLANASAPSQFGKHAMELERELALAKQALVTELLGMIDRLEKRIGPVLRPVNVMPGGPVPQGALPPSPQVAPLPGPCSPVTSAVHRATSEVSLMRDVINRLGSRLSGLIERIEV